MPAPLSSTNPAAKQNGRRRNRLRRLPKRGVGDFLIKLYSFVLTVTFLPSTSLAFMISTAFTIIS